MSAPPARPSRRRALWPEEASVEKRRRSDEPSARPAEPNSLAVPTAPVHEHHNMPTEVSWNIFEKEQQEKVF